MRSVRPARLLLASTFLVAVTACGSDNTAATTTTVAVPSSSTTARTALDGNLPPVGALALEPLYGDALAAIGLRLTDRGGLIDRSDGGYTASSEGQHLALYVEPIDDRTLPQYIDGIRGIAVIFAGDIFERWPGLASFDICQEPVEVDAATSAEEPLPVTQIEMTRAQAAAIDFDTVSVIDLVRSSLADPPGLDLRVSTQLANDPAYAAIVELAKA